MSLFSDPWFPCINEEYSSICFRFPVADGIVIIIALLFSSVKGTGIFRTAVFTPIVISSLACIIFGWLFSENFGYINYFLVKLDFCLPVPGWPPEYGHRNHYCGQSMVQYRIYNHSILAGLQSISADILGGSWWRNKKTKKILYCSANLRKALSLLNMGNRSLWRSCEPMVLTGGGPGNATRTLYMYIYNTAFKYFDMGYASAMALYSVDWFSCFHWLIWWIKGENEWR